MIVKALMENTTKDAALHTEHGLSLYIETNGKKILFDTGQSSGFANNADRMGVDLAGVDFAVLSHAHFDHSDGLPTFLARNDHAPVYLSTYAFMDYQHEDRYIGVNKTLEGNPRFVFVKGDTRIADGLDILTGEGRGYTHPVNPDGLGVKKDGVIVPEDFRHEQYLLITENGKRVLISGCSHKGIVNIMNWFRPDVLIGGFHFMNFDLSGAGKAALDLAAKELLDFNTVYYTCHCTGVPQFEYLKPLMKDKLFYLAAGEEITL